MHVFNYKGTLSEAEWRIARYAFFKRQPNVSIFLAYPLLILSSSFAVCI